MAVPAGVDEASRRVDDQTESPERALAVEASDDVVGERDPFDRRAQHELTRVQDHRRLGPDVDQLREVFLGLAHVDHALGVIAKDPEVLVDVQVDRRGLDAVFAEGLDDDPTGLDRLFDGPIREHH